MDAGDRTEVVVGFDGSGVAASAVVWAAAEAARRGAPLRLVTAAGYPAVAPQASRDLPWACTPLSGAVAEVAHSGAALVHARQPRVPVGVVTATGSAASALVEASSTAALVVVGSRGGRRSGAALGSVAASVSAHSACPVVVVRGAQDAADEVRPVVAGVDGSAGAAAALAFAADHAATAGAPLEVLAAWRAPAGNARDEHRGAAPSGAPELAAHRAAQQAVVAALAEVAATHPEVRADGRIVDDSAACALSAASRDAGLVVVGSHGAGATSELLLGSVSRSVLHTAACPVAVVHLGAVRPTRRPQVAGLRR
jgi:nucleotide-binding universal stress UspA family protein